MWILYNVHISWNVFIFLFFSKLIKNVKTILTTQKQMVNWVWLTDHSLQTLCLVSLWGMKVPLLWLHLLFLSPLLTTLQPLLCPANSPSFFLPLGNCLCSPSAWDILPLDVSMANFLLHNYFGSQVKCQVITEIFPDTPVSKWASHPQVSPTSRLWTNTPCQIGGGTRLEIKYTINVIHLNHLKTILHPPPSMENWSLVPKMLGTTVLPQTLSFISLHFVSLSPFEMILFIYK